MRLREYGVLILVFGCATTPREPYVWREDKPPVGVHRADVARAEGRVMEYLASSGGLDLPGCRGRRDYQVITVETETAYEVFLIPRPGLCDQAPEDTNVPAPWPWEGPPTEFAVSKKDFHIIRERWRGDDYIEMPSAPSEPPPKWPLEHTEPTLKAKVPSRLRFAAMRDLIPPLFKSSFRVPVGDCVGPVRVETQAGGGAQTVTAAVTVNLTATPPSAEFFSDAICTTAVTSVDVRAGADEAKFYFRPAQVGQLRISASADGLRGDFEGYDVEAGPPVALGFITPPQTVIEDTCSKPLAVQLQDAFGNRARVEVETSLQLLATPPGSVNFYAEPGCTGAAMTAASIPANGDSAVFFFKGRVARTAAITAALGAASVGQDEVIAPAQPAGQGSSGQKGP